MFKFKSFKSDLGQDLVKIQTMGDGSCFFHAILQCVSEDYKLISIMDRARMVIKFRHSLADKLTEFYPNLSRGTLTEFSKAVPDYTFENMKNTLKLSCPVDNVYNEFISDVLNLDIYLVNPDGRPYVTGNDSDILFKNRKSIVILYTPGHYESIGRKIDRSGDNFLVETIFQSDDGFICAIRDYLKNVITK